MRTEIINILAKVGGIKNEQKQEAVANALMQLFASNRQSGSSHPPFEENGVKMVWCSRHGKYHTIDYMVPNKSKELGVANYCRAAQRKWEWMHAKSSIILSYAAQAFVRNDAVQAKKLVDLGNFLKETKNVVSTFDNIDIEMTSQEVVQVCEEEFFAEFPELKSKQKSK